jgi:hypothetical protein
MMARPLSTRLRYLRVTVSLQFHSSPKIDDTRKSLSSVDVFRARGDED